MINRTEANRILYDAQFEMIASGLRGRMEITGVARRPHANDHGLWQNDSGQEFYFARFALPDEGEKLLVVMRTRNGGKRVWEYRDGLNDESKSLLYQATIVDAPPPSGTVREEFGSYNIPPLRYPRGQYEPIDVFAKFAELNRLLTTAQRVR